MMATFFALPSMSNDAKSNAQPPMASEPISR